jgi:hypothetical protein
MKRDKLELVLNLIDEANAQDPNREIWQRQTYPKELLYGMRMTACLEKFHPAPCEILQIAARGQHIRRWEIPRNSYPETREGYLKWRTRLYGFHADQVTGLMDQVGYGEEELQRADKILQKRGMHTDPEVQTIEDVACLVFLEFTLPSFVEQADQEKLPGIVRKTWKKMSENARSVAITLPYPAPLGKMLLAVLAT